MAGTELDDDVLRPLLELAFVVAVVGARQRPPLAVPAPIKPYLRFQKLPSAALVPVRKALEEDEDFRARVALVGEETLVGRIGWLWLHRPEGWEDEAAGVVADDAATDEAEAARRLERSAVKRLDAAEQAARRATAELAAVRAELAAEHRRRTDAEHAATRAQRRLVAAEEELAGARRRLGKAQTATDELDVVVAQLVARDALLATRDVELGAALDQARALEAQLAVAVAAPVEPARAAPMPVASEVSSTPVGAAGPSPDHVALAAALTEAAAASRQVAAALAAAGQALLPVQPSVPRLPSLPSQGRSASGATPRSSPATSRGRRRPAPLPGGVVGDSIEAAFHLVRVPGILVVVDGYNAAKLGWPDLALAEQRARLLDALDELVMRAACDLTVVFDGADVVSGPSGRRLQRVLFSPPAVSADEVIVELVESTSPERPVVVATTDREIRDAVASVGANVVSSAQLLAAIGRRT